MLLLSLLVSDQNNEASLYKANIGLLLLQSVTKMLVKIAILAISCFYLPPPLENFGKNKQNLWKFFIGLQHCIGGEEDF